MSPAKQTTMRDEYENILINALATAAKEMANGDSTLAIRHVDRWIEDATTEFAAELAKKRGLVPCGQC